MRYLVRADRCDAELENWTVVPSILAGLVSRYRRNHCRTRWTLGKLGWYGPCDDW